MTSGGDRTEMASAAVTAELIATSRQLVLMAAEAVAEAQEMCARLAAHPGRKQRPAREDDPG